MVYYFRNPKKNCLHLHPDCSLLNKSKEFELSQREDKPDGFSICRQCLARDARLSNGEILSKVPKTRKFRGKGKTTAILGNEMIEGMLGEITGSEHLTIKIGTIPKGHKVTVVIENP